MSGTKDLDARAAAGETVVPGGTGGLSVEAQQHLAEGMHVFLRKLITVQFFEVLYVSLMQCRHFIVPVTELASCSRVHCGGHSEEVCMKYD